MDNNIKKKDLALKLLMSVFEMFIIILVFQILEILFSLPHIFCVIALLVYIIWNTTIRK